MGRPEKYTEELVEKVLNQISTTTKGLKTICHGDGMPCLATVMKWVSENTHGFTERYARAKEAQADMMADEMLDIADDTTGDVIMIRTGDGELVEAENREFINRSRLRVDTRKWIASKLKPKKYGDRMALTGGDGGPIEIKQITGMVIK